MKKLTYASTLLLLICALPLFAQNCVKITGTVQSLQNLPLQGVAVFLRGSGDVVESLTYTDVNGNFEFPDLERGEYELRVEGNGFQTITAPIQLEAETLRRVEINLREVRQTDVPEPSTLPRGMIEEGDPSYPYSRRPLTIRTFSAIYGSETSGVSMDIA